MKKYIGVFLCLMLSTIMYAKDIHVGDVVSLKIAGSDKNQILEGFSKSKFEIDSIEKTSDGYIVKFRSFSPGESSVLIGDKKITIDTKSTLTKDEKEIYPNLSDNSNNIPYNIRFPYEVYVYLLLGGISLYYLVRNFKLKHREIKISPDEKFNSSINNLDEATWPFQLSYAIREYIDAKLHGNFLSGDYKVALPLVQEDIDFLNYLDNYKFSREEKDIKAQCLEKVKDIYSRVRGDQNEL